MNTMNYFQLIYADNKLWLVGLSIGLVLCFFGSQIFLKSLFVFGFLALALPGYWIGRDSYGLFGGIAGFILCGLLGGMLFVALCQVGVFLLGFLLGAAIGLSFTTGFLIPGIAGIISGIVFVLYTDAFIILGTALLGSYLIGQSLLFIVPAQWFIFPGMLAVGEFIMFVLGCFFQMKVTGRY